MLGWRLDNGQTLWLVRWTPDRAVRARSQAGALVVFLGKTLYPHSAPLYPEDIIIKRIFFVMAFYMQSLP